MSLFGVSPAFPLPRPPEFRHPPRCITVSADGSLNGVQHHDPRCPHLQQADHYVMLDAENAFYAVRENHCGTCGYAGTSAYSRSPPT